LLAEQTLSSFFSFAAIGRAIFNTAETAKSFRRNDKPISAEMHCCFGLISQQLQHFATARLTAQGNEEAAFSLPFLCRYG